ncbi:hypothetical protein D4R89_12980 [bacterium]|nr:MAG: hypothetical protein D4R89_12980 [bacterium]
MRVIVTISIHGIQAVKNFEYSDDVLHFDIHKAAKEWVCYDCAAVINPGVRYAQATINILGHSMPFRACLNCVPLVNNKLLELKDQLRNKENSKMYLESEIERLGDAIEFYDTASAPFRL